MAAARAYLVLLASHLLAFAVFVNGSMPEDLSNYQNEFVCDTAVRLVRPRFVYDIKEAIEKHTHLQASGTGHSRNRFYCALSPDEAEPDDDTTATIVMTTMRPLSIFVDEADMSVWVSAGMTLWDLMVYLGEYITPSAPKGYALGTNPLCVNQTIAGAIATGTHGSSLTYGSLSNLAIGFKVVLANGTTAVIDADSYPLYFRAFQVSVGRLGVVTDVKMRIIKETLVRRTLLSHVPRSEVVSMITEAQEMYKSTGDLPSWLDGFQLHYRPIDLDFTVFTHEDAKSLPDESNTESDSIQEAQAFREEWLAEKINAPINLSRSELGHPVSHGVEWEVPLPLEPNLVYEDANNTETLIAAIDEIFLNSLGNATIERHEALSPRALSGGVGSTPFDTYEVAVPVDKMADCLEGFLDLSESMLPDDGLRNGALIRFVGKDSGLLSVSYDKPQMWFEIPDFVYYNQETRQPNLPHRRLMAYLVTSPLCSPARLHWAFAGWPDPGCWNGAESYKDTWCDFGCVVRALDPDDKFASSVPEMWNWDGAHLERCCTEDGYDTSLEGCDCSVIPVRTPEECPEAPFYTNR